MTKPSALKFYRWCAWILPYAFWREICPKMLLSIVKRLSLTKTKTPRRTTDCIRACELQTTWTKLRRASRQQLNFSLTISSSESSISNFAILKISVKKNGTRKWAVSTVELSWRRLKMATLKNRNYVRKYIVKFTLKNLRHNQYAHSLPPPTTATLDRYIVVIINCERT